MSGDGSVTVKNSQLFRREEKRERDKLPCR